MKKYCIFPDETEIELDSILDQTDIQTYISYCDEGIPQMLWVPNEFVSSK